MSRGTEWAGVQGYYRAERASYARNKNLGPPEVFQADNDHLLDLHCVRLWKRGWKLRWIARKLDLSEEQVRIRIARYRHRRN